MVVTSPVLACGIAGAHGGIPIPRILALGLLMGVLSNVIPYGLDQVILRRAGQSYFAVLLALLPLSATAIGVLVMHQIPSTPELLGILAIVVAVAARRDAPPGGNLAI
ncbi:Conserved hypthetical membrane protein [Mycobacteroides abscessus subsp. massiliense]|nr:Conserved hypthetical membrane protein [Mycobacteroides abscessus subsp. massiliense]SKH20258.1 Conserved hypthetical membrane protein [Mycobacteroides abscessus subsp. massiliense]SKI70158.1 Conserved hypthetical membrane protein [Mycobacteroides abscessus subsp. massiliense]SKK30223.1 Conserved hypthetical membrane protein [Mycobacteroides abscessus subsp. massiliense]SKL77254.1 Conserved hypthetical membrane protein [Mycobacteroides abscessus subsp. massiliense]